MVFDTRQIYGLLDWIRLVYGKILYSRVKRRKSIESSFNDYKNVLVLVLVPMDFWMSSTTS